MTALVTYEDDSLDWSNQQHSVRADVRVLDRHELADTAARNIARTVQKLEGFEHALAKVFAELEAEQARQLQTGLRSEPDWDRLPIVNAGHNIWQAKRVGDAPLPPLVAG